MFNRKPQPPKAKKVSHELVMHGDVRQDPYYWMNERDNPEVIRYLTEENAYLEKVMAPLKGFRETLFEEMKGRIKETDMSVPYKVDDWYFYTRYEEGQEYPIYCYRIGSLNAPENICSTSIP
jgi:oligopeptidase B